MKVIVAVLVSLLVCIPGAAANIQIDDDDLDALFNMSIEELLELEVYSASKMFEKVSSIPASAVVITRDEIEAYGYLSVLEILQHIPGLYVTNDLYVSTIGVRGFHKSGEDSNIVIMVDGMELARDFSYAYPPEFLNMPVYCIERIEVIRGPMSVLNGNGAFYGVINIITESANTHKQEHGEVAVWAGSSGELQLGTHLHTNIGGVEVRLTAKTTKSDGLDTTFASMMSDPERLYGYGLTPESSTAGLFDSRDIFLKLNLQYAGFTLDVMKSEISYDNTFLMPSLLPGTNQTDHNTQTSLSYERQISDQLQVSAKVRFSDIDYFFQVHQLYPGGYGTEKVNNQTRIIDLQSVYAFNKDLSLQTGFVHKSIYDAGNMHDLPLFGSPSLINNSFGLKGDSTIDTIGLYSQLHYAFSEDTRIVAGLRAVYLPGYELEATFGKGYDFETHMEGTYKYDKVELVPRLALVHTLSQGHIIKLLYGQAFKTPSFFEMQKNVLFPGRAGLEPERIKTYEINYLGVLGSNVAVSASLFRNELDNLLFRYINYDKNGGYSTWNINGGELTSHGLELTVTVEPSSSAHLELSGSWQNTTDDLNPDRDYPYAPEFLGYLKAAFRLPMESTLGITANYVGGMSTFWDETIRNGDGSYGAYLGKETDGVLTANIHFRMNNISDENLYTFFRIENMFDENITYPTTENNTWADLGIPGKERTYYIGIGRKF